MIPLVVPLYSRQLFMVCFKTIADLVSVFLNCLSPSLEVRFSHNLIIIGERWNTNIALRFLISLVTGVRGKNLDLTFYRKYLAVQKMFNQNHQVSVAINGRIQFRLLKLQAFSTNSPPVVNEETCEVLQSQDSVQT